MRTRVRGRTPGRAIRTAGVRALSIVLAVLVLAGGGQAAPPTAVAGMPGEADGSASGPPVVLPRIDCAALVGQARERLAVDAHVERPEQAE